MSISASNGWVAWVMSNSSGVGLKRQAETQEGRTFEGAAFSKTLLNLVVQRCRRTRRNPSSQERRRKVARSWVRVNVMTRRYRRAAGLVKSARSKTRDAAVQIV